MQHDLKNKKEKLNIFNDKNSVNPNVLNIFFKKYMNLVNCNEEKIIFSFLFLLKNALLISKSDFMPCMKKIKKVKKNKLFICETFNLFEFIKMKDKFKSLILFNQNLNDFEIEMLHEFSFENKIPVIIFSKKSNFEKFKFNLLEFIKKPNIEILCINKNKIDKFQVKNIIFDVTNFSIKIQ